MHDLTKRLASIDSSPVMTAYSCSGWYSPDVLLSVLLLLSCLTLSSCDRVDPHSVNSKSHDAHSKHGEGGTEHTGHHIHKIIVTSPIIKDVTISQPYVCQIHSRRHIEIRALDEGYLEEITIKEGQAVNKGDLLFRVVPVLYQARLDAENAEVELARIKYENTKNLLEKRVVSAQELALSKAEYDKAKAKLALAVAEFNFASVKAPFDGIVDRMQQQEGSLVSEGDILTTLSDNQVIWVYFNVPESRYLDYKQMKDGIEHLSIKLKLANGQMFDQQGKIGAIEADFNNETGNIAFRADFPNPEGLIRHGQTGTILVSRTINDAIVIPQRATYEILAKRYCFVVDEHNIVHQRDIDVGYTLEDLFVVDNGLSEGEKVVMEGVRQIADGQKIEYEYIAPEQVLEELKFKAE